MAKKIRKLKVYSQGDPWRRTEQPMIRFGGKWLRDAGFQPNQPYRITIHAPGVLTLDGTHQPIARARSEQREAERNDP